MKFSVVMPLYNKEKYVGRAIESVLSQTHEDFKLLVVDDGSTDHSLDVVASYRDERIRIIRQVNAGVSCARNAGIRASSEAYIAFLDADDAWKPEFLSVMQQLIESYPLAGAYSCSFESIEADGSMKHHFAPGNEFAATDCALIEDYFLSAMSAYLITSSSVVIPRRVIEDVGAFNPSFRKGEDIDLWQRIALKYSVAYINKTYSIIYANSEDRSNSRDVSLSASFSSSAQETLARAKEAGIKNSSYEEYMIKIIIHQAKKLIALNKCCDARKLLYHYKYTRYNKKALILTFLFSLAPLRFIRKRGRTV